VAVLAVSRGLRNESWWPAALTEAGVAVLLFAPPLLIGRGIEIAATKTGCLSGWVLWGRATSCAAVDGSRQWQPGGAAGSNR
jgi:hypothetical protein